MRKVFAAVAAAAMLVCAGAQAQVPTTNGGANWISFLGNDSGTSYSPLDQINRDTVGRLKEVWSFTYGGAIQNSTPVVVDGTMYLVGLNDRVHAFDAATGKPKWTHDLGLQASGYARGSASVAVGFGMVYYGTRDNHLVALDAATGREVWDVQIESCSCTPSHGILIVKDKIVVGVRGDNLHRSYINAFDAKTGRHVWRWWVIPGPGEPGHETWPEYLWKVGGGATWMTGSYDPKLNLIFWGTANPQPIMGSVDPQAKKWTNSVVALDADTGKMKWGFQEAPRDEFDYDSSAEAIMVDAMVDGKMTPLIVHSVKSGETYVINRATGKLVSAYPHADTVTWNKGLDAAGQPIDPLHLKKGEVVTFCPSYYGSRAANHGTYSPKTGLWYGSSSEFCSRLRGLDTAPKVVEGRGYNLTKDEGIEKAPTKPFIGAFDPVSGKRRWKLETEVAPVASLMSTGGGLIFGGDMFGQFWALDAETGKKLWTTNVGGQSANSPMSYSVNGKQYIAMALGGGGAYPMRIRELWKEEAPRMAQGGARLVVFTLDGEAKP